MKKEDLAFEIAEYINSQGDHNTREVTKIIMELIDEFKWWVGEWHKSISDYRKSKISKEYGTLADWEKDIIKRAKYWEMK